MTTFLFFLPLILTNAVLGIYAERKISAFIQDRMGPMETGKFGILQTTADIVKLIQKEDIVPAAADKLLFKLAPIIIFTAVFAGFAVVPLSGSWDGAGLELGVFYLIAIISLDVLGILMAGWGSNSKFSLFGALRSVAQIISYEVPLGLAILCVVVITQTLDLQEISHAQGIFSTTPVYLFGVVKSIDVTALGGFLAWNIVQSPLLIPVFAIFFIASLAECNRAPFDLPEAESELIGGYHTEYSGFRWAFFMLAEYGMMLLVSILAAVLFFGSWNTPLPNLGVVRLADWTTGAPGSFAGYLWGVFWLLSKALIGLFLHMWIRWTYPRLRIDQLMKLSWKYLTPAALLFLFLCGIWRLWMIA